MQTCSASAHLAWRARLRRARRGRNSHEARDSARARDSVQSRRARPLPLQLATDHSTRHRPQRCASVYYPPYTTIMRTKHTPHSLAAFPIYSSAFVSPNELVLGGGGGQSRSGIKNKLVRYLVFFVALYYVLIDSSDYITWSPMTPLSSSTSSSSRRARMPP